MEIITLDKSEKELRTPSKKVPLEDINTPKFQKFLDDMYVIMVETKLEPGWMSAGVSGVQVGNPINIFYAYNTNTEEYQEFINPQVEMMGTATDVHEEGCLSIPEAKGEVRRHKRIRVTYLDRNGEKQRKQYKGWNARVIQHEYDHLLGILFIDKLV